MFFSRSIQKIVAIYYFAVCLIFSCECPLFSDEQTFDLFTKACMKNGCNPQLIQSGRAVFDVRKTVSGESKNSIEERVQAYIKRLQEQFRDSPDQLKELLTHSVPIYRTSLESHSSQEQLSIIFRGNDLYFNPDAKQSWRLFENRIYDSASKIWRDDSKTICYGNPNVPDSSLQVRLTPGTQTVGLNKEFFNNGEFQLFGRVRGVPVTMALGILLADSRRKEFTLTQTGETALKQYMDDNGWSIQTSGVETYDENSQAIVVEILKAQKVIGRYWLDESRDFICPFVQVFDDSGVITEEYKSSDYFLHKDSGLWFPTRDTQTVSLFPGARKLTSEYRIHPETLQLNVKIADEEFMIDVQETSQVIDFRNTEKQVVYTAVKNGTMSLAKNGHDPPQLPWLVRQEDLKDYVPPTGGASGWARWLFAGGGIILVLAILFQIWRKRLKTTPAAFLLLLFLLPLLLSEIGCVQSPISQQNEEKSTLATTPAILDFGKVRPTDSPVKMSFDLYNHGNKSITITDIQSGCGCTVIDFPPTPIPPNGSVPVHEEDAYDSMQRFFATIREFF